RLSLIHARLDFILTVYEYSSKEDEAHVRSRSLDAVVGLQYPTPGVARGGARRADRRAVGAHLGRRGASARAHRSLRRGGALGVPRRAQLRALAELAVRRQHAHGARARDRKSTRLNSSHV